jgi:hypothetical protein
MTWRSLLHALSNFLEPREREVVLGDIEESNLGDREAVASMLGLIARRQLQPWLSWKPWLAMLAVTLPAGVLLSYIANGIAASNSVYLWMYTSNWTPTYLRAGWLWSELMPEIGGLLFSWFILVCWSWTAGFVIASVSRIHSWMNAGLVSLVLFTGAMAHFYGRGDGFVPPLTTHPAASFTRAFYNVIFPAIMLTFLVLLPAIIGLRQRQQARRFSSAWKNVMKASICVTAVSLLSTPLAWRLFRLVAALPFHIPRFQALMPLAIAAPAVFLVATGRVTFSLREKILAAEATSPLP